MSGSFSIHSTKTYRSLYGGCSLCRGSLYRGCTVCIYVHMGFTIHCLTIALSFPHTNCLRQEAQHH